MKATYNVASNYKLYDSVIFNLGTTLHIFNDWVRFISKIKPFIECVYAGLYIEQIISFKTAVVILNTPKGKEQILLIGAAYILGFYTSLVCT